MTGIPTAAAPEAFRAFIDMSGMFQALKKCRMRFFNASFKGGSHSSLNPFITRMNLTDVLLNYSDLNDGCDVNVGSIVESVVQTAFNRQSFCLARQVAT